MASEPELSLMQHVQQVPDPRVLGRVQYRLTDLIVMAVCAVIAGADNWVEVAAWCDQQLRWLQERLQLTVHQAPSHDTFGRVFRLLDASAVQSAFQGWLAAVSGRQAGEIIAIDGKTLRHSFDRWHELEALQVVNIWACSQHVMLAQQPVAAGSNEIPAVPELLEQLVLAGCIVTADAMHTQTALAAQIIEQGADYVLPVKENQPTLAEVVLSFFAEAERVKFVGIPHSHCTTVDKDHGRIDTRHCWASAPPEFIAYLTENGRWRGLASLVRVRSERRVGNETTTFERFFISSLPPRADQLLEAVRAHWQIENQLHWVLDVVFREDDARVRLGYAAQNFALLRRLALSLIARDTHTKGGVQVKRKKAAWNLEYLYSLIQF